MWGLVCGGGGGGEVVDLFVNSQLTEGNNILC